MGLGFSGQECGIELVLSPLLSAVRRERTELAINPALECGRYLGGDVGQRHDGGVERPGHQPHRNSSCERERRVEPSSQRLVRPRVVVENLIQIFNVEYLSADLAHAVARWRLPQCLRFPPEQRRGWQLGHAVTSRNKWSRARWRRPPKRERREVKAGVRASVSEAWQQNSTKGYLRRSVPYRSLKAPTAKCEDRRARIVCTLADI